MCFWKKLPGFSFLFFLSMSGFGKLSEEGQIVNIFGCGPHGLFQQLSFAKWHESKLGQSVSRRLGSNSTFLPATEGSWSLLHP